ncbi:MAG: Calx-beta domain-containing protein [Thermoguttaceae bacterium]
MKRIGSSRRLVVEWLEKRHLLSAQALAPTTPSFDPSPAEQEMLEHLNRMRMDPQGELEILFTDVASVTARDPDARLAMTVYQDPSPAEISSDWAGLSAVEPLAWNVSLYDAALDHSTLMAQYDDQSHLLPGELSLSKRLAAAGYAGSAVGENVFAYMNNVFHGHSAFAIDWGVPDRSHRDNMMASTFREVGISILADDDESTQVGPLLVTQDYGDGADWDESYLLGVVWDDANDNGWYDGGEGLGDVQVVIEGPAGTFTATSMTAGGYQAFVPDGTYTVTAYGGQLPSPMVFQDVVVGHRNVKVDFEYDPYQNQPPVVDLNGPAEAGVDFQSTFYESSPPVPITATDGFLSDADSSHLVSLTARITNLRDGGEYLAADTTGVSITSDYDASTGILTLVGNAPVSDYQQVLATLSYGNVSTALDETPRVIEVETSDGMSLAVAQATVFVVRTTLPELTIGDLRVEEHAGGSSTYEFTVRMSDTMGRDVTVDFATEDVSALAGSDYRSVRESLRFSPGETLKTVSFELVDDEVSEGTEAFLGRLSNPSGATIAAGTATVTVIDDDAAVKLGTVDFLGMTGIDLTAESQLYRFTAIRQGLLSVELSGGADSQISLVLYDQYQTPETALSGVSTGGVARLDLPQVEAGQTYYLEVTGTASDAGMLLGNVVQQAGSTITVLGTGGDDAFEFRVGEAIGLSFNGLAYSYAREAVQKLLFRGGEGVDQANLAGGAEDDTASLFPRSGILVGSGYTVTLEAVEAIQLAGGGGNDTVQLYDSPGSDSFVADGDIGGLSGEGYVNSVTGFGTILGYATAGGDDSAELLGTEGYEEFIGKPTVSKVVGATQYIRTKEFDRVTVVGNGGGDFARIYGDDGVEHFDAGPMWGEMVGAGFTYRVDGYLSVHGYARGKDGDTATLVDSLGDDTLIVTPLYAKLVGDGYVSRAKFFADVEIVGTGMGVDSARLYDSKGNDSFVINVSGSTVSGAGFARRLSGFDDIVAYSREGGTDMIWLYDTAGNDTFSSRTDSAFLSGSGFLGRAYGFADVRGVATAGGNDTARFYAGNANATFRATVAVSTMDEGRTHRRAEAFAAVYAEAGEGIDAATFEASGRGDDLFESGDDWQQLTNQVLGVLIRTLRFEQVTGPDGDGSTG